MCCLPRGAFRFASQVDNFNADGPMDTGVFPFFFLKKNKTNKEMDKRYNTGLAKENTMGGACVGHA